MNDANKTQPKAEPRLVDLKSTYILIPDGEVEDRIARAWVEATYGDNIKAQVVTAVPLLRLRETDALLVAARKKLKPTTNRRDLPGRPPEDYQVPIEELMQEVTQRGPILIDKHWIEGGAIGGKVDQTSLIVALNQISQPFCVRYRADEGLVRLFYF